MSTRQTVIPIIATGGGPCGGKEWFRKSDFATRLRKRGILPMFIPEVATDLLSVGCFPLKISRKYFQQSVAATQIDREDAYMKEAVRVQGLVPEMRVVLFANRGLLDVAGYLEGDPVEAFQRDIVEDRSAGLKILGYNVCGVKDAMDRYIANVHITTAADGAEEAYLRHLKDNPTRTETPEEARNYDRRILEAWKGHPNLRVVKNVDKRGRSIPFERKMEVATQHILDVLDVEPMRRAARFA